MGGSVSQIGQNMGNSSFGPPQQSSGKSGPANQPTQQQGFNGNVTMPGQGGQPQFGAQNPYSNTVGQWDNSQISPVQQQGKGKGA